MADGIIIQAVETKLRESRDRLTLADSGADRKAASQLDRAATDRQNHQRPGALQADEVGIARTVMTDVNYLEVVNGGKGRATPTNSATGRRGCLVRPSRTAEQGSAITSGSIAPSKRVLSPDFPAFVSSLPRRWEWQGHAIPNADSSVNLPLWGEIESESV